MNILETLVSAFGTLVVAAGSFAVALTKVLKGKKSVKTEYEKEVARNAINAKIEELIQEAEQAYNGLDKTLKVTGTSAGSVKFRDVLLNLHDFCLDKGFAWDNEAMKAAIEAKVNFTKTVNSRETNV